jgi:hypothetical protein
MPSTEIPELEDLQDVWTAAGKQSVKSQLIIANIQDTLQAAIAAQTETYKIHVTAVLEAKTKAEAAIVGHTFAASTSKRTVKKRAFNPDSLEAARAKVRKLEALAEEDAANSSD